MPSALGPHVPGLADYKIEAPVGRPGSVSRESLLERLREAGGRQLVSILAPAGYGKTTLLAQWAAEDARPFAWIFLDEGDNDPSLLLRYLRASLQRAGVMGDASSPGEVEPALPWPDPLLAVAGLVADSRGPYVLVLDDVHVLSGESLDVLVALARRIPGDVQLALCGRTEATPLLARSRVRGQVLEIGVPELALSRTETVQLLRATGVDPDEAVAAEIHRWTEGWAAGVYLAALAARSAGAPARPGDSAKRFVGDYLWAEHLAGLSPDVLAFLTSSSALDRMSASLCDTVLDRTDSARMLDAIGRASLFLVALDDEGRWFRYHELFRAELRAVLARDDPTALTRLATRASAWYEANGLLDEAMEYALSAGDDDLLDRLFVQYAFTFYRSGRTNTVERWLERLEEAGRLERRPGVAVIGALLHALGGRTFGAERSLAVAVRNAERASDAMRGWIALVEALLCRNGPEAMERDATLALGMLAPDDPLRAAALLSHAVARLLLGDATGAERELEQAIEVATTMGAVVAELFSVGLLASLQLCRGDLERARLLLDRVEPGGNVMGLRSFPQAALLLVVEARTSFREGNPTRALEHLMAAQYARPYLTDSMPAVNVLTLLEMARAHLDFSDTAAARSVLVDADAIIRRRPRLGAVVDEVVDARERAASEQGDGASALGLTAAELRLLPLLTTHLTFAEIGKRLFISRNTVKTQAISIYRKLGASSRGDAVTRAAERGLLKLPRG